MAKSATRARAARKPATKSGSAASQLREYNAKRDLKASGEPGGEGAVAPSATPRYVIQKHDATRLHYDLRLEMDGVFRSWAVPKGMPAKAGEKSLAVEVEDHPLDYGSFEGTIPEGNYGAGTVMLWDRGNYTVSGVSPEQAFKEGKIHFAMLGEKCQGEWTLVRMPQRGGDKHANWLLIKNSEAKKRSPFRDTNLDVSVKTGRTMEEIAGGAKKKPASEARDARQRAKVAAKPNQQEGPTRSRATDPSSKAAAPSRGDPASPGPSTPKAAGSKKNAASRGKSKVGGAKLPPPQYIEPMKALAVPEIGSPDEWLLECKYDGYRALAIVHEGHAELWSRNEKPLTSSYPEVAEATQELPCVNAILDGEIVALDPEGRPTFQLLQGSESNERPPILFYVFDLLHLDGQSLINEPIETRRAALEKLVADAPDAIRLSPVFDQPPDVLMKEIQRQGLEGIVAKRRGSLYEPGRRSGSWAKKRIVVDQEFVIGGYTPPKGGRTHFGALLVGYYEGDQLMYAGKVGAGFNGKLLKALHDKFRQIETGANPFANLPTKRPRFGLGMTASAMREVTWLEPELVAQIKFSEWTRDGMLRQPVFLGLREDKPAREVVREGTSSSAG